MDPARKRKIRLVVALGAAVLSPVALVIGHHDHLDVDDRPVSAAGAPLTGQLDGTATIDLVATQDLDRFDFDPRDMEVPPCR